MALPATPPPLIGRFAHKEKELGGLDFLHSFGVSVFFSKFSPPPFFLVKLEKIPIFLLVPYSSVLINTFIMLGNLPPGLLMQKAAPFYVSFKKIMYVVNNVESVYFFKCVSLWN